MLVALNENSLLEVFWGDTAHLVITQDSTYIEGPFRGHAGSRDSHEVLCQLRETCFKLFSFLLKNNCQTIGWIKIRTKIVTIAAIICDNY